MVATAPWFTSPIGVPALGAAPLPVSRSVAIGARAVSAFTPTFVAPRELQDLVVHALVKTTSVDLHESLFWRSAISLVLGRGGATPRLEFVRRGTRFPRFG